MGVFTHEEEFTSIVAPGRLFKAFVHDSDNLIPKVAPQAGQSVEILEGNGGPGTIKTITLADDKQKILITIIGKYMKHKIDSIDHDNFAYGHSLIEGDVLSDNVEKISHETKLVAAPGGGSILKVTTKLCTVGDAPIDKEKAKEGKEKATGLFKLVEAYLLANPDAYN